MVVSTAQKINLALFVALPLAVIVVKRVSLVEAIPFATQYWAIYDIRTGVRVSEMSQSMIKLQNELRELVSTNKALRGKLKITRVYK